MRIKNISARNFKGQTFQQNLSAVTVIAGPNAVGKSSRIEAMMLAQLKYLPGLSKKPNDIFNALASGNPMVTEVEFENGNVTGCQFVKSRGSVKLTDTGNGRAELPAVLFDANEYFSLSASERTRFIFARAKVDLTIPKLVSTITANIKNIKLEENTPQTEQVINDICGAVENHTKETPKDATPQQFIAALYDGVKDKLKLANENSRRMAATVQGLTQIKEDSGAGSDIEQRLAKARQELEKANAETARCLSELNTAKQLLDAAEAKRLSIVGEAETREKLSTLEKELELLKQHPTSEISTKVQQEAFNKANIAHNESIRAYDQAKAEVKRIEKERADCQTMTNCPTCGASLKSKHEKLENELAEKQLVSDAALLKADEQFNITAELLHDAETALEDARKAQETHMANITALNEKQTQIATLTRQLESSATAAAEVAKIPALMESVRTLKADYDAAAQTSIDKKMAHYNLEDEHSKLIAARAEAKQRATSIEQAARFKAEALVLKETVGLLEALQKEIIKQSVQPILDTANALCEGILHLPLAMLDGEIGMMDKKEFVTHKSASDSEKLLIYAALSIALATDAPFRLCMIGRMESFDYNNRLKLIERCLELVAAGKLDQCIFIEVSGAQNVAVGYENFNDEENFSLVCL